MSALTENCDMAEDVLDRVSDTAAFLEEVLNRPDGLDLSPEATHGLMYVVRDMGLAVRGLAENNFGR